MLYDGKHFEFFVDFVHFKPSTFRLVNQYFLEELSNEEKSGLTLEDNGIMYVRNKVYSTFIRKKIGSEKYRIFFKNFLDQEAIGLRKDLSKILIRKPLAERIEYLVLQLHDIKSLIDVCRESAYSKVNMVLGGYIISELMEVGAYFLNAYKTGFTTDDYQYFYNSFYDESKSGDSVNIRQSESATVDNDSKELHNSQRKTGLKKKPSDEENLHFTLRPSKNPNRSNRSAQVVDLYDSLSIDFISCSKNDFIGAFGKNPQKETIVWKKEINKLKYLINKLIDKEFIDEPSNKWQVTVACFRLPEGEITTKQLQLNTKKLKDTDFIDRLISYL